jgi:hypothetical protein
VALAFIDNPMNLPSINHKDENKQNNSAENLEWCTNEYNLKYGSRMKRQIDSQSKPVAQILHGKVIAVHNNSREAQKATGVNYSKVRMCCRGERKTAGGFVWKDVGEIKKENEDEV